MVDDKHTHKYTTKKLKPIQRIDNPRYSGSAGDKAFIVQLCKCGAFQAIDYGPTKRLKEYITR